MNSTTRGAKVVLVVEDNPDAREVFVFSLITMGYTVVEAENGVDALRKLGARPVDVILTDLRMPVMDGYEFASAVKSNPAWKKIPIALISATPLTGNWAALEIFEALLVKPASLDQLASTIDRLAGIEPS
jgi:CheY-like chemotaxis protein